MPHAVDSCLVEAARLRRSGAGWYDAFEEAGVEDTSPANAVSPINFGRPGALLGSSVAFGSGCGKALPGMPRKAPLCSHGTDT